MVLPGGAEAGSGVNVQCACWTPWENAGTANSSKVSVRIMDVQLLILFDARTVELLHSPTAAAGGPPRSSSSIRAFTLPPANSAATRIAFLMALALDRPWQMMQPPRTPSRGAPPYSE